MPVGVEAAAESKAVREPGREPALAQCSGPRRWQRRPGVANRRHSFSGQNAWSWP